MKSNRTTLFMVLASVLLLTAGNRLELLAIVAPLSILAAMLAETASVEYRRKR